MVSQIHIRGQTSLPVGGVCAAVTVVTAGAVDGAAVGLFVLSRRSFADDTLYGAVILLDRGYGDVVTVEGLVLSADSVVGVATVFDGAGVGVAAKVAATPTVATAVVVSLAALVGGVRDAVVPVASASTVL